MTVNQVLRLFQAAKGKLPHQLRPTRAMLCAYLRSKGFNANVWAPTGNEDSRLAHLDVSGYKGDDKIAISVCDKAIGCRAIKKLLQLPDVVTKVIVVHDKDYKTKTLDNGIIVIGL